MCLVVLNGIVSSLYDVSDTYPTGASAFTRGTRQVGGRGPACPDPEKGERGLETGFSLFRIDVQVGRFPRRNTISMSQQPPPALQVTLSPARRPLASGRLLPRFPLPSSLCLLCVIINTHRYGAT